MPRHRYVLMNHETGSLQQLCFLFLRLLIEYTLFRLQLPLSAILLIMSQTSKNQ